MTSLAGGCHLTELPSTGQEKTKHEGDWTCKDLCLHHTQWARQQPTIKPEAAVSASLVILVGTVVDTDNRVKSHVNWDIGVKVNNNLHTFIVGETTRREVLGCDSSRALAEEEGEGDNGKEVSSGAFVSVFIRNGAKVTRKSFLLKRH